MPSPENACESMLSRLNASDMPCTSCIVFLNKEMTEVHAKNQVIVENYHDLFLDKEKLHVKLEQVMKENSDLQQKNNELEMRLKQLTIGNVEEMAICENEFVNDISDVASWPDDIFSLLEA